jgi:hypothetical protein
MSDKNTQEATSTSIVTLLTTEEATVVAREAMLLRVREGHTVEGAVASGRRKGGKVLNEVLDPTQGQTSREIVQIALLGKF